MNHLDDILWGTMVPRTPVPASDNTNKKRKLDDDVYFEEPNKKRLSVIDVTKDSKKSKKEKEKDKEKKTTALSAIPLDKDEPKDHSFDSNGLIYSCDNHIYFNTDINNTSIIMLQKEVKNVVNSLIEKYDEFVKFNLPVKSMPVILHINSPGGGVFATFKFIDYMTQIRNKHSMIKFHTIVEGRAASGATLISITGDERYITENGYMLIHQLWSFTSGKYNEIKDDVTNLDSLMVRIKQLYKKHTKVPEEQMDEILKHDLYWDADTCKKYKLVDTIIK